MKNILIDIGNSSHCKTAFSDGKGLLAVRRLLRSELRRSLDEETALNGPADVICVSSVAAGDMEPERWLKDRCRKLIVVNASTPMPLRLDYSTPETLGSDRIAAAVGAMSMFPGEDCIIFDFGTAITVDFVSASGIFRGGNISPGLSMRLRALHQFTGRLPLVDASVPCGQAGKNTSDAVNNGVVLGIIFEVERYINNNPGSRVIFTGGDALFFAKMLKSPIFVVCNLVLTGLSKIAQVNV